MEEMFRPEKVSLFLTDASSVPHVCALLRSAASSSATRNNVLVGRIGEDDWAIPALQIVVSTPEDAYNMLLRGILSPMEISTVALDEEASTHLNSDKLFCIKRVLAPRSTVVIFNFHGQKQAFTTPADDFQLPEMFVSSTLLSFDYCRGAALFAAGRSLVLQEFSAVMAFMLGILRSLNSKCEQATQALLLAPVGKLERLSGFMQSLARHLGMADVLVACPNIDGKLPGGCHVLVATPAKLHRLIQSAVVKPSFIKQVVIVELDQLGATEELSSLFKLLPDRIQVGIHSDDISCSQFQCVMQALGQKPVILPRKSLRLEGVKQLVRRVRDDDEKVEILVELCNCLQLCRTQVCVYCSSSDAVTWLGEQLSERGLIASQAHRNLSRAALDEVKQRFDSGIGFQLLLTEDLDELELQGAQVVVNFSLPSSVEDYFNRVASYAGGDVAINLISGDAEEAMLDEVRQRYNVVIAAMLLDVFDAVSIEP